MSTTSTLRSRKQATNVSVRRDLLAAARSQGINLSATLEAALEEQLRRKRARGWLAENREAVAAYNERVARRGLFGDGLRRF